MPDRTEHVRRAAGAPGGTLLHQRPERWLFRGVYGLVLASAMVAALDATGDKADPGPDALWILLSALASGAAHGFAHVIAQRVSADEAATLSRLRSVLAEWPLVAAALPTVAFLLAALAGWWPENTAVDVALLFNTAALLALGTAAARIAGRSWPYSFRAGSMDMLLGVVIISVYALLE